MKQIDPSLDQRDRGRKVQFGGRTEDWGVNSESRVGDNTEKSPSSSLINRGRGERWERKKEKKLRVQSVNMGTKRNASFH